MKHSLQNINKANGFTLVELLVTIGVMAVVLTALCEVYFAVGREWERQSGQGSAIDATSQTVSKISDFISQSDDAAITTRFTNKDTLKLNLPADTAHGIYVPSPSGGKLLYKAGNWIVFYLSDSTGSYSNNGNILWLGNIDTSGNVTPNVNWSKYSNGAARITPLSSISFFKDPSGIHHLISMDIISTYTINQASGQKYQFKLSASVCLMNSGPQ